MKMIELWEIFDLILRIWYIVNYSQNDSQQEIGDKFHYILNVVISQMKDTGVSDYYSKFPRLQLLE
jgi:hypothetical protein